MTKRATFSSAINRHKQSVIEIASHTPLWVLLVPFVFMPVLIFLDQTPVGNYLDKDSAEIAAPIILGIAFFLSLIELKPPSHVYFRWQAFFGFILFMRELHFYGTNNGFYIGFLLMVWWGSRYRERLLPYFNQRLIIGFLVTIIWTYLVSKTFDRHYWDNLIPAGIDSDLFEENLELIGHLMFLSLVIITYRLKIKNHHNGT